MENEIIQDLVFLVEHKGICFVAPMLSIGAVECTKCLHRIKQVCYLNWFIKWEMAFYGKRRIESPHPKENKTTKKQSVYEEAICALVEEFGKEYLVELLL